MAKPKAEIIYEETLPAVFVNRINRFTAAVRIDSREEIVHVKNTGRLENLLLPGAKVTLQKAVNTERKTVYDLISVYKPKLKWVKIQPEFHTALSEAVNAGVQVCCFSCHVEADRIRVTGINEISSLVRR